MLTTFPFSNSLVSSPKYHTFPCLSWAYQSNVFSVSSPFTNTRSSTTTTGTPRIILRFRVTSVITVVGSVPS